MKFSKTPLLTVLTVSVLLNAFFAIKAIVQKSENKQSSRYEYLSKRIFAENRNDVLINFIPLRQALKTYVTKQPYPIGVYFEYLPAGTSIGVNDTLEVKIASLIKIPVVMATYKAIEEKKLTLDQVITIDEDDIDSSFGTLWEKGSGTTLTIQEAINLILKESDNTASRALTDVLPELSIERVFDSLDIPKNHEENYTLISPKNYTSILRSLYLSSYLEQKNSNALLDILTQTNYNDKLPAGVKHMVPVAHKIGVYNTDDKNELPIYSDCGIVYVPNRPYSLCIMMRGYKEEEVRKHMQLISSMVYQYIVKVN